MGYKHVLIRTEPTPEVIGDCEVRAAVGCQHPPYGRRPLRGVWCAACGAVHVEEWQRPKRLEALGFLVSVFGGRGGPRKGTAIAMTDKTPSERQLALLPPAALAKCDAPVRAMAWITDEQGRCLCCKRRHADRQQAKICITQGITRARARAFALSQLLDAADLPDETYSDNDAHKRRQA